MSEPITLDEYLVSLGHKPELITVLNYRQFNIPKNFKINFSDTFLHFICLECGMVAQANVNNTYYKRKEEFKCYVGNNLKSESYPTCNEWAIRDIIE